MGPYKPDVTVLVTHHISENARYLELCVNALKASVGVKAEIIVISDANETVAHPGVRTIHDKRFVTVAEKWSEALRVSSKESKYFLSISDDVMVSKHMIRGMVDVLADREMILGPMSNCDATTRYYASPAVEDKDGNLKFLPVKTTWQDIEGYEDAIINFPPNGTILIDPGWISFYCVMLPKSVIEKVGPLDQKLEVRYNDVDYCQRARRLGIPSLIHLGVFALHFGDRTIPKVTSAAQYAAADRAWMEKHQELMVPEDEGDLL